MTKAQAPIVPAGATRGRRSPDLLARPEPPVAAPGPSVEIYYVVGKKPLRFRGTVLQPGEEVPGAGEWTRIEAWVNARQVVRCSRLAVPAEPEQEPAPA